jgi:predicted nucleic acid-binding protein
MNESGEFLRDARRLVLDTNVVMALWHFEDPGLPRLRARCEAGGFVMLCRADSLDELRRVLAYRQFGVEPVRQEAIHARYAAACHCLPEPDEALTARLAALPRCGDRDDQKFLEIAWAGEAGVLLTRDKLLLKLARRPPFRDALQIMTPERFEQGLSEAEAAMAQESGCAAVKNA